MFSKCYVERVLYITICRILQVLGIYCLTMTWLSLQTIILPFISLTVYTKNSLSFRKLYFAEYVYWVPWPWILVQVGYTFPRNLSIPIAPLFLAYIYSAAPLKVSLHLNVVCTRFWVLTNWIIIHLTLWLYHDANACNCILCFCFGNLKE